MNYFYTCQLLHGFIQSFPVYYIFSRDAAQRCWKRDIEILKKPSVLCWQCDPDSSSHLTLTTPLPTLVTQLKLHTITLIIQQYHTCRIKNPKNAIDRKSESEYSGASAITTTLFTLSL